MSHESRIRARPNRAAPGWRLVAAGLAAVAWVVRPAHVAAQSVPLSVPVTRPSFTVSPALQSWSFGTAIPLDSIQVSGVRQLSAPIALQLPLGTRWTASITGAVASTSLTARDSAGSITRDMTGLTDVRVRASGQLLGDALSLTVGLNVPTGTVNLSPAQNDVVRVTAAPALEAQVPIAGLGFGGTVGLVHARTVGAWAVAVGASGEKRGTYSPLDAQIAGISNRTDLEPGGAFHLSLGADGLVGGNRLLLGVVTDFYGKDLLRQTVNGGTPIAQRFQLGPTIGVGAVLELKSTHLRDLTLRVNERYRGGFRDAGNRQVDGSSGNYLDVGLSGLRGTPGQRALLLGVQAAQHTGLPIDKGLIGASLTSAGATVGVVQPAGAYEYTARATVTAGSLKTSLVSSGVTSLTLGLSVRKP